MKIKEWLIDLAEHHMVDMIDGEIVILPIMEDDGEIERD